MVTTENRREVERRAGSRLASAAGSSQIPQRVPFVADVSVTVMGMGHTRTARTLDLCRDGVGLIGTALGDVGQTLLVLFPIGQSSGRVVVESAIGRIIQIHGDEDATYFSVEFQTSLSEATTPNLIRRLLRA